MAGRAILPTTALRFEVFGRRIAVACDREELAAFVQARWKAFLVDPSDTGREADEADVVFHLTGAQLGPLREGQFFNNGHLLVIGDNWRLVTGSFYRRPWQVHIQVFGRDDEDTYYYVLEPLLLMVLARLNLVHWHSAAVSVNGGAVLLVGPSGSGKSTTTLSFLHAGYAFVADDEVFLEGRTDGVATLGLDSSVYATDDTLAMFPRLHHLKAAPLVQRGHGEKRRIPVQDLFPSDSAELAAPIVRVVLFPTVAETGRTALQPLSTREAMRRFLSHKPKEYPALVIDAPSSQRRLDTYATLARTARCFDVTLGADADLPEIVRAHLP